MGYYIRVLSTSSECVPLSALRAALQASNLQATLTSEAGESEQWTQLVLSHPDGCEIALIERNPVGDNSLGSEELAEFVHEVADRVPASAANWLLGYFPRVRCIYAFQVLGGTKQKNGSDILGAVKNRVWSFAPSILQADNEGFSNEDGYHILWQFRESVTGFWWMGVLSEGQWKHFRMDLGDARHREAFFQGMIPDGAELA